MSRLVKVSSGIVILALLFVLYRACNPFNGYFSQVSIRHIELLNLPGNRLRFRVIVTCDGNARACLKYWKINTRDTFYTAVTNAGKSDTINIQNTEAESHYRFQVIAYNGYSNFLSKPHDFQTQLIYHATPYFDLEPTGTNFENLMNKRYLLTQILTEPGSLVILNGRGNIVWYQPFKKGVKVSHWTPRRTILCIVGSEKIPSSGGDEIYEMDLNGKVLRHFKSGDGRMDKLVHHEVRYDAEDNLYALTFTKKVTDLSTVGGMKNDTVHGDGIVVFNPSGKKIWEWSILDHLNPIADKKILKSKKDWVHANALFREKDGNFLISFRDLSQIWKVAYPSGKVLWKLGNEGDFPLDSNAMFTGQHSVHIDESGRLMMLDNGAKRKQSRAMAFTLDTVNKKAKVQFAVSLPKQYFTATKGSAALFDHDKVLFCLTDPKVFLITDMQGKILWKVNLAGDAYRLEEAVDFLNTKPITDAGIKF